MMTLCGGLEGEGQISGSRVEARMYRLQRNLSAITSTDYIFPYSVLRLSVFSDIIALCRVCRLRGLNLHEIPLFQHYGRSSRADN